MADARPDPDELLKRVQAEEERARQGRLKIYFGAAPGVGKTYAMLEHARELVAQGVELVVGVAEAHGRKETEILLEGLEVLPRRQVVYRGRTFEEFDLDAALERRPTVLLVDELAHTNIPGLRHEKRWQDVMEILAAGIDVETTLNVQHIASLNDVVAQITGVSVRETVPDAVFERADEVELVDLPPDALLKRLEEGRVYIPDQAAQAASNFFRKGNLLALRELALRLTARRVDSDMREYREQEGIETTWPAAERILVCVGPGPRGAQLVRAARRMAAGLRADWAAVHVEMPGRASDRETASRIEQNLRLAESLGADVATLSGERASTAVLEYARARNVTRIIVGKPTHARWRDLVFGSFLDELIRGSGEIEVEVISGLSTERAPSVPQMVASTRSPAREYASAALILVVATGANLLLLGRLQPVDFAMIYLLAVAVVATRFGPGPSILAALSSVALFDFMFVPPYLTFTVHDIRYATTFVVMIAIGMLIANLTGRIRRQAQAATEREQRTAALYSLARELAGKRLTRGIASVAVDAIEKAMGRPATVLLAPHVGGGQAPVLGRVAGTFWPSEHDETVALWAYEHREPAGKGTDTLPGGTVMFMPLLSAERALGVVALQLGEGPQLDLTRRHLLEALCQQTAVALERAALAGEAQEADRRAERESLRSSLLSSVSHDLRTPLATITGAVSSLIEDSATIAPEARDELLATVREEADRLNRLVGNLLDMTRLESGGLVAHKEWTPLEEVVGSALGRLEVPLGDRPVAVELAKDLPLAFIDALLMEQALVNLVENAAKYTPVGSPIDIRARSEQGMLVIDVADRGPGIPEEERERIFEKLYRLGPGDGLSAGLGLAICKGIVAAHGGEIAALSRPDGGTIFRITLSQPEDQPEMPREERD